MRDLFSSVYFLIPINTPLIIISCQAPAISCLLKNSINQIGPFSPRISSSSNPSASEFQLDSGHGEQGSAGSGAEQQRRNRGRGDSGSALSHGAPPASSVLRGAEVGISCWPLAL